eukprot:TRINITY_DN16300_c0_g1_i1.p1 TRINITY_DN16300_c0_g1~~TRINITY_DN16300_c0_g1_i1.p1  ORF type:complete len:567 (+),score=114.76 TRINITY_DN16300_c0_g1_i1:177-1877(+)
MPRCRDEKDFDSEADILEASASTETGLMFGRPADLDADRSLWQLAERIGDPLSFLPKDVDREQLRAYRIDYQAFRLGGHAGACGEVGHLCPSKAALRRSLGRVLDPQSSDEVEESTDAPGECEMTSEQAAAQGLGAQPKPGFKAAKKRKTQDFIEAHRSCDGASSQTSDWAGEWEAVVLGDGMEVPPWQELNSSTDCIVAQVAAVVVAHCEDGAMSRGAWGPADDEFHEAHFFCQLNCLARPSSSGCWLGPLWKLLALGTFHRQSQGGDYEEDAFSRGDMSSVERVQNFIKEVAVAFYFCKQLVVLGLVYLERLLQVDTTARGAPGRPAVCVTPANWRSLLVAALLTASKVWEDVHPWNVDFEAGLRDAVGLRCLTGALYKLESLFLQRLDWRVFVPGATYACYFMALVDGRSATETDVSCKTSVVSGEGDSDSLDESRQARLREFAPACGTLTSQAVQQAWLLDQSNPLVGSLRHAPRALAPSKHLRPSATLLYVHELAMRTTGQMTGSWRMCSRHPGKGPDAYHTVSGATGKQLAAEVRDYLSHTRWESSIASQADFFESGWIR